MHVNSLPFSPTFAKGCPLKPLNYLWFSHVSPLLEGFSPLSEGRFGFVFPIRSCLQSLACSVKPM